ncbi:hypothetical protein PR048_000579, partial [Dryococelus australis]
MELPNFKNFKSLYSIPKLSPMMYRKSDVNKEPLNLWQSCHHQVKQENIGSLFIKRKFKQVCQNSSYIPRNSVCNFQRVQTYFFTKIQYFVSFE